MPLGPNKWNAAKPYYDGLTLAKDGDTIEQQAATQFGLDKLFPNYEIFWKYHVCPATVRPRGITFRPDVSDIISVIAQRSYTVLTYILESMDYLRLVEKGELDPRNRYCYITIIFAGNALQVFTELQNALTGNPNKLSGMDDLATQLGVPINLFPNWQTKWRADRDSAVNYRNYLTHQGRLYTVTPTATNKPLVLKRSAFQQNVTYTWTHAESDYNANPANWISLSNVCKEILKIH